MGFIGQIALILIATLLAAAISQRVGMPAVIGQLIVGVILGPGVFGILQNTHLMHAGSEIGVIILMFIAGIESDLDLLKKYFKPAISVAAIGVLFPMVAFYAYGELMGQGFERAIFWGVIFAATSVSISVEVLREFKKLNTKEGATILGAAVVDDIIAVILLSIFVSSFGVSGDHAPNLLVATILQLIYFLGVIVLVKWVAPVILRFAERIPVHGSVAITSLFLCLSMAWLADVIGLSSVVGAFFAGVAVSQTKFQTEVSSSVSSVGYTFFIPIFFVSIGLDMEFSGVIKNLGFIVIMTLLAIVTKLFGGAVGAAITKMDWHSSFVIGSGMVSRGEMALIIAQIGLSANLMAKNLYSEIIIVIVLSTIVAPLLLKRTLKV
ncbi:cation:proton antiporter [Lentilactobacillus kisonensis]|uniref:Na+/H+ antiporter n=2 Tax=Lentilactobacillus kisonensis TaxID=481722 RepID=H1LJ37_9LACO|nr:cation:proton antiporter [Lentilactobacillus kisonensis]EHO49283.1 Na+/H+ antiporter [Lentilactobacillus kisonensis F0435]KRL23085.1 Na+ H+ antiporter [Lentilactobacillus kisonensis DSM 19906 = JCM 15041]